MRKAKNLFWGLFFIIGATLIVLNQLNVVNSGIGMIKLFTTMLLVAAFIKSARYLSFLGMFFSLAFIGMLYDTELGIEALTPFPILLVALLFSIGFGLMFKQVNKDHRNEKEFSEEEIKSKTSNIDLNVSFGASTKYVNTRDVENIHLDCKFGACKLYLDKATLKNNQATLNVSGSFGGMELYIPKSWKVVNNINCMLGGVDEKNTATAESENVLTLEGHISFSGIEIIYI